MAKHKRIKRELAAETIRAGILHGREDGALWGVLQDDGNDQPRWFENRWRAAMGNPLWAGDAYRASYLRSFNRTQKERESAMSPEERREAKRAVEQNHTIFWETRSQREVRLLRERVELAERRAEEVEQKALASQK